MERWICRAAVSGTGPIMDGHLLVTGDLVRGRWWYLVLHVCIRENAIAASGPCHTVQASPTQLGGWVQVHGRRTAAPLPAAQHPPLPTIPCGGRPERGSSTTAPGRGGSSSAAQQAGAALPATRVSVLVARQGANKC